MKMILAAVVAVAITSGALGYNEIDAQKHHADLYLADLEATPIGLKY